MKIKINLVSKYVFVICIFIIPSLAWTVQKAKIVGPVVEIYADSDFDSEIISYVREGESFLISNKTYGAFYRIKLKDGKIGYIVDYELDIEGKGKFKEKDLDALLYEGVAIPAGATAANSQDEDEAEEAAIFGRTYAGPTLQLINFRENTLGGDQVDDLLAIGYKKIGDVAWSLLGAFKTPKYYTDDADKIGGTAKGIKLWADFGFSSNVSDFGYSNVRFSGAIFTQVSLIQFNTPVRKYDLHDITVGLVLESAWLIRFKKSAIDIAIKYYFDKTNYAGLGLSLFF